MNDHDREGSFLNDIQNYYTTSIKSHGISAKGVDWNESEGQISRYRQLLKVTEGAEVFSILDYGCGYGALVSILKGLNVNFNYLGLDISPLMIQAAINSNSHHENIKFEEASEISIASDFVVASGVFSVKLSSSQKSWKKYIHNTLDSFNEFSNKGFAFNCLSSYSDTDKRASKLYYADPLELFDLCKKKYSDNVSLIHNYGLYEFTILVNK
jgi:SAM-dependent methyltransferase